MRVVNATLAVLAFAAGSTPAAAETPSRVYSAAVHELNATLLASHSATKTLEGWCADHRLSPQPVIVAQAVKGAFKPITSTQRKRLRIGSAEPVRYRRVELKCGAVTLSNADNWYVPSRLTPEMNAALDTTQTPFGKVVAPLNISRRTVSATLLWDPMARLRRLHAGARPPADILQHRADVIAQDGRPIAEVVETYTGAALGFIGRPPLP